jgi:hypothetical protein
MVPVDLLQPLESGVLALVSCCDKKQVPHFVAFSISVIELTSRQIQQIHACSSAAVRSLLKELVQLHDTSYKYTGVA